MAIAGAKLKHLYSVGPIVDGIGVNLTAWSYGPELAFAVIAGHDNVPDAHGITDALHDALEELETACGTAAASAAPRPQRSVSRSVTLPSRRGSPTKRRKRR